MTTFQPNDNGIIGELVNTQVSSDLVQRIQFCLTLNKMAPCHSTCRGLHPTKVGGKEWGRSATLPAPVPALCLPGSTLPGPLPGKYGESKNNKTPPSDGKHPNTKNYMDLLGERVIMPKKSRF